jgi:hypothetical protein
MLSDCSGVRLARIMHVGILALPENRRARTALHAGKPKQAKNLPFPDLKFYEHPL